MSQELLYMRSPFVYHEGMQLKRYNKKTDVNTLELSKFISRTYINTIDMAILDAIYDFEILNRHCLELYLKLTTKADIKSNLKKLVALGIIARHAYEYEEDYERKQTPYFYSLTPGAFKYLQRFHHDKKHYPIITTDNAYRKLSLNQFDICFMNRYSNHVTNCRRNISMTDKGKGIFIDLYYSLSSNQLSQKLDLYVIPVRQGYDWQNSFKEYMENFISFLKNSSPIVIFLAESDQHVKEIHRCISDNKINLEGKLVLYTTDLSVAREPILDYLYECSSDAEHTSLNIKKLAI